MLAVLPVGLSILLAFLNASCSSTLLSIAWLQGWGPCCREILKCSVNIDTQRERINILNVNICTYCLDKPHNSVNCIFIEPLTPQKLLLPRDYHFSYCTSEIKSRLLRGPLNVSKESSLTEESSNQPVNLPSSSHVFVLKYFFQLAW